MRLLPNDRMVHNFIFKQQDKGATLRRSRAKSRSSAVSAKAGVGGDPAAESPSQGRSGCWGGGDSTVPANDSILRACTVTSSHPHF